MSQPHGPPLPQVGQKETNPPRPNMKEPSYARGNITRHSFESEFDNPKRAA